MDQNTQPIRWLFVPAERSNWEIMIYTKNHYLLVICLSFENPYMFVTQLQSERLVSSIYSGLKVICYYRQDLIVRTTHILQHLVTAIWVTGLKKTTEKIFRAQSLGDIFLLVITYSYLQFSYIGNCLILN